MRKDGKEGNVFLIMRSIIIDIKRRVSMTFLNDNYNNNKDLEII